MIVRMLVGISGTRNDSAWPPPGGVIEVPDPEGWDLVSTGKAVKLADSKGPVPVHTAPEAPRSEPSSTGAGPVDEDGEKLPLSVPRPAAPKQDWVDWAVHRGASEDEANSATKQQLMEIYGSRP